MAVWPNGTKSRPTITSGWMGYPGHYGTDFVGFDYNCSVMPGVVIYSGWNDSGAGNEVRIRHDNGDITRYLHNERVLVAVGQRVAEGQRIGVQGSTGFSTGKHVHYEVWPGGNINNRRDPVPYTQNLITSGAGGNPRPITERKNTMTTLYHLGASNPPRYALAGDSPGTPANWMETEDYGGLAVPWARAHNSAITLKASTWNMFKDRYVAPLQTNASPATAEGGVSLDFDYERAARANAQALLDAQANRLKE